MSLNNQHFTDYPACALTSCSGLSFHLCLKAAIASTVPPPGLAPQARWFPDDGRYKAFRSKTKHSTIPFQSQQIQFQGRTSMFKIHGDTCHSSIFLSSWLFGSAPALPDLFSLIRHKSVETQPFGSCAFPANVCLIASASFILNFSGMKELSSNWQKPQAFAALQSHRDTSKFLLFWTKRRYALQHTSNNIRINFVTNNSVQCWHESQRKNLSQPFS